MSHWMNKAFPASGAEKKLLGYIPAPANCLPASRLPSGPALRGMHSAFETAGARDTEALSRALAVFYRSSLEALGDGAYRLVLPEEGERV